MRCHICNSVLSEKEINWNRDHKDWEPCSTCLTIINEVFEPMDEDDIYKQLVFEWGEYLVPENLDEEDENNLLTDP